jgi:hypothetical protein
MRAAGKLCSLSDSAINHYEHGRMDLDPKRIEQLLVAYGYTRADFEEYLRGRDIPLESARVECISLINLISEEKLRAVQIVLSGFVQLKKWGET